MKILHVINSLSTGGAEKLILDIVPFQAARGFEVDVVLLNGQATPFRTQLALSNCCRILDLSFGSVYNPRLIFKLASLLGNYDIVHVHLFPAQYLVVVAKIISGSQAKLVFTEHSTFNTRMKWWMSRLLDKLVYRCYSNIICISNEVKEALKEKYKLPELKLKMINNGINLDAAGLSVAHDRSDFNFQASDVLIVMVAAFRESKDHTCLINALSLLPDQYKLILVGEGSRILKSKNLVKELQLDQRVSFLGLRSDVYSILKMCNIGVLSSHWEGFGIAAVEYMACGLPAVVSEVRGLSEVVGDVGIKFEAGNSKALATAIQSLWENEAHYNILSERGLKRAELFSLSTMVDNIGNSYRQLFQS